MADRFSISSLPLAVFEHSEVSTNICIAKMDAQSRKCEIELTLNATPTNNVEVAIGRDFAPTDGLLSEHESACRFGWDCGLWFVCFPDTGTILTAESTSQVERKTLSARFDIRKDDTVRLVSFAECGCAVLTNRQEELHLSAKCWNAIRATTRCEGIFGQSIDVRIGPYGTELVVR